MTPRAHYYATRKAYRLACAQDAVEADEQYREARQRYAYQSLRYGAPHYWPVMTRQNAIRESISPRLFAAITSRPSRNATGRLPRGPRANAICDVRSRFGQYANLDLNQRIALRRALKQAEALNRRIAAERAAHPLPVAGQRQQQQGKPAPGFYSSEAA